MRRDVNARGRRAGLAQVELLTYLPTLLLLFLAVAAVVRLGIAAMVAEPAAEVREDGSSFETSGPGRPSGPLQVGPRSDVSVSDGDRRALQAIARLGGGVEAP